MVKPQDSGQPRHGSVGDPQAGPDKGRHPGTRKKSEPETSRTPAEGTDPSLTHGETRERRPRP
jgi:hypothetical protein